MVAFTKKCCAFCIRQTAGLHCLLAVFVCLLALTGHLENGWADELEMHVYQAEHALGDTLVAGPDNNLWINGDSTTQATTAGEFTYVDLASDSALAVGADGYMWGASTKYHFIAKIDTDGTYDTFALEHSASITAMVQGTDGNIWFLDNGTNQLGKITTDGIISYLALPEDCNYFHGIAVGPEGNFWITCSSDDSLETIVKATPEGEFTTYAVDEENILFPGSIVSGGDGNLWYITYGGSSQYIAKITPSGKVTYYSQGDGVYFTSITCGSDGNIWFVASDNAIGFINASGAITRYSTSGYDLSAIGVGPDGNIWTTAKEEGSFIQTTLLVQFKTVQDPLASSGKFLIWQNTASGEMRWWNLSTTGKIISNVVDVGQGKISDETLGAAWRFAGTTTLDGVKTLFYQNITTGKVKYWKLSDGGTLSESGLVSDEVTVGGDWQAVDVKTLDGTPTIIWQNQASGKVVYWLLESSGKLVDAVQDSGWGFVSDDVTVNSSWRLTSVDVLGGVNTLLWQNQSSGRNVYWRLNAGTKLIDADEGSGWGFMTSLQLNSQWRQIGILNDNYLVWQGQDSGKIVWWRLGDDAKLTSEEREVGWAFVSDDVTLHTAWLLGAVTALGDDNYLLWHNTQNGAVVYWELDDEIKLPDAEQGSGWDYISDALTMPGDWTLNCITD